jgi:Flp pilus assembly protein CpaB
MKPKQILLLSIAAGLLAVVLAQVQLRSARGKAVMVYRVTTDVHAGEKIGTRFEPVGLPGENYFPNLLKEAPTGAEMEQFVRETPVREPVRAGEVVLFRHFESTVDAGIGTQIPPGMKAVSIPVDEETSVSYLVQPGDSVDVLAALPRALPAAGPGSLQTLMEASPSGGLETRPLLQAVKVLAVGRRTRRDAPAGRNDGAYSAVTLLVSLEEAQKVTHARDVLKSPMTLALRSPRDKQKQEAVSSVAYDSPAFDRIGNH